MSFALKCTVPAWAIAPLPETSSLVPSRFAVFLSAVSVSFTVHAAAQSQSTVMPLRSALRV